MLKMKYTNFKLILIICCLIATSNTAIAFDFKGIEVGSPKTYQAKDVRDALGVERNIDCGKGKEDCMICNGVTSIGGAIALANIVISPKGVVTRIALKISSDDFLKVVSVAIEKYGKPTKITTKVEQNIMGAKFQNISYLWQGTEGRYIKIDKYYNTLDYGEVYFGSAEDTALLQQIFSPKKEDI
jgi:hypothetical protein